MSIVIVMFFGIKTALAPCEYVLWTLAAEGKQQFSFCVSLLVDHTVAKNDLEDDQSASTPWTLGVLFFWYKQTKKSKGQRFLYPGG